MSRSRCCCAVVLTALGVMLGPDLVEAADAALPVKAGVAPRYDWNGFYAGGHVGYSRGHTDATGSDPASAKVGGSFGALYGGLFAGYNYVLPSRMLIGVEADLSFPNYL